MFRCLTLILFLFCFYSGLVAADKTDDNALLLQLDKMIEQREVYQKKVEKEITELRKMLDYVGDDKAKFDILSDLFVMYRSFKVDTALIVAEERLQLADRLGEEYVNQGLMNLADALNKIGKHEKALEVLDRVKRTERYGRILIFIICITLPICPAIMMKRKPPKSGCLCNR